MSMIVDRDKHPVAWRESGRGLVALFLHGLGGARTSWDPQLSDLSDLRRCVAWDMPGYGASDGSPDSLAALADSAAALIIELGAEQADVVGLSLGGMIAQHLALRHPDRIRSLALLDTSPAFGLDGTTKEQWLTTRVDPINDTAMPADVASDVVAGLVGADCSQQVRTDIVNSMRAVPAASLAAACAALVEHDVRDLLHQVQAPTTVLVGAQDTETPASYAREISDRIAGSELHIIEGSGHLVNLESPKQVNQLLRELWGRAEEATDEH